MIYQVDVHLVMKLVEESSNKLNKLVMDNLFFTIKKERKNIQI